MLEAQRKKEFELAGRAVLAQGKKIIAPPETGLVIEGAVADFLEAAAHDECRSALEKEATAVLRRRLSASRRRSAWRCVSAMASLTALACPAVLAADEARPSVILIVIDALRADHMTQFGYPLDTSSSLSLLTDRATRFQECYSPAPWTVPAVASIFSGLSPARHDRFAW